VNKENARLRYCVNAQFSMRARRNFVTCKARSINSVCVVTRDNMRTCYARQHLWPNRPDFIIIRRWDSSEIAIEHALRHVGDLGRDSAIRTNNQLPPINHSTYTRLRVPYVTAKLDLVTCSICTLHSQRGCCANRSLRFMSIARISMRRERLALLEPTNATFSVTSTLNLL